MDSFCVFIIFACLFPKSSADILSDSETGRTASTVVKEGLSAEIFCMVEGTGDYFWSKGESFQTSILVASFTGGNDNKDNEPYVVTVNGTLFIRKVTLTDEGKYYCRFTSVENECHGKINVIVQASLSNFFLAIDRCDSENSCLLYLNPSQSISLTCTAHNAPPLMTLKWFNGSKEITEGIEQNEILSQNGNSREITSKVAAVYGYPASLTCQAVDPKRSNDDVRFAHAQIEMTVHAHESLPSWIIVSVTSAGCFIVFGIFLLITAMANRKQKKKYKMLKKERYQSLQVSAKSKDSELSELKERIANNEGKITANEEIAKIKDQEIKNKDEEITKMKLRVPYHLQVISSLKGEVQSQAKAITDLECKLKQKEEELKKKNDENIGLHKSNTIAFEKEKLRITAAKEKVYTTANEITKLKDKLRQQEEEIKKKWNANVKLRTNLQRIEIALQRKSEDISELKGNLTDKDHEFGEIRKELAKLKEELKEKNYQLEDLYRKSRSGEKGSHRRQGKNEKGN